jgi:hypothetical protein
MKHKNTKMERKNYLIYAFNKLCDEDQASLESLTAQLTQIHRTSPEKQVLTGKNPENTLQQNKRQDN